MSEPIGIVGFGFSGLMVLANLLRRAEAPLTIYLIDPLLDGKGLAYRTPYDAHLLNVRAENMGAFADEIGDFARWLAENGQPYGPSDFVPRNIYGDYLAHLWVEAQGMASAKGIHLKLVPSLAVAVQRRGDQLTLMTERGDAIALAQLVLATGNEMKPMHPPLEAPMLQDPWGPGMLAEAAKTAGPILLLGTGLTAVDMVLALRAEGYAGTILATSRNLLLPQPHRDGVPPYGLNASTILGLHSARDAVRWMRDHVAELPDWRMAVDALRPHTQRIWQQWKPAAQRRFLRRLGTFWNVHRHRMAPQIAAKMAEERLRGGLKLLRSKELAEAAPALVINCTGPELDLRKSRMPLYRSLLAEGLIEPHDTGLGLRADARQRAWGQGHPHLYATGALLTGQLLESTAVPELRVGAATVAEALWQSRSKK